MIAAIQIALMAGAAGLTWWAWQEVNLLRGTVFFEYRYVLLLSLGFILLSLAQVTATWTLAKLFPSPKTDAPK